MCTRYFIEQDALELKDILNAATGSSLADKFIRTHGRPIITSGEVRPTDIVPVIAPNQKGIKNVFPMQWGFTNKEHNTRHFNARIESAGTKPTINNPGAEPSSCIRCSGSYVTSALIALDF